MLFSGGGVKIWWWWWRGGGSLLGRFFHLGMSKFLAGVGGLHPPSRENPVMTSQILKSEDFTKTQKSRYLKNETLFFLRIKKFINYTSRAALLQKKSFAAEVTFKSTSAIMVIAAITSEGCWSKLKQGAQSFPKKNRLTLKPMYSINTQ